MSGGPGASAIAIRAERTLARLGRAASENAIVDALRTTYPVAGWVIGVELALIALASAVAVLGDTFHAVYLVLVLATYCVAVVGATVGVLYLCWRLAEVVGV